MQSERLEFLNGLRGWAAVIVLLHHIVFFILTSLNPIFDGRTFAFVTDGRFAVFTFFVLSGFVLSISFIRGSKEKSLAVAATSRYFRLLIPILVVCFFSYLLLEVGLIHSHEAAGATGNDRLNGFYNFAPSFRSFLYFCFYGTFFDFQGAIYDAPLWTMPIEFMGSMLIYFVLGVFRREKVTPLQIPVAILTAGIYLASPQLGTLLLGYYLAEIYHRYHRAIDGWTYSNLLFGVLSVVPVLAVTLRWPDSDYGYAKLALLLVSCIIFCKPLRNFFSNRLSRFLGQISFPLYLVHVLVLTSLSSYMILELPKDGIGPEMASYIIAGVYIPLSVLLAYFLLPVEMFSVTVSKRLAVKILAVDVIKISHSLMQSLGRFADKGK